MSLILFVFLGLCLYGMQVKVFNREYISRQTTVQINGIFVVLVFLSHFVTYLETEFPYSFVYMNVREFFSQLVVTTFLFYSGYGVLTSIDKKQAQYVQSLPIKILELLLNFSLAIGLFVLVGTMMGKEYTLSKIVLACIGWTSVGNSNWYLFDILLLYGITYISFSCCRDRKHALWMVFGLSLGSMVFLFLFKEGTRWYNTFLCFWLGMMYGEYRRSFEAWIQKDRRVFYGAFLILILGFLVSIYLRRAMFFYILHALLFTLIVNLISMKVEINNPFLKWAGAHIFSIYILQRIPMMIGDYFHMNEENVFFYFGFTVICTMVLAQYFDRFLEKLSKKLFLPMKKRIEGY